MAVGGHSLFIYIAKYCRKILLIILYILQKFENN